MDVYQFGGSQGCSNLTVFATKPHLQILDVRLVDKLFHKVSSLIRMDPEVEILRGTADDLVAAPTGLELKGLVHVEIAIIYRADNRDCQGASAKGLREFLL